MAEATYKLTGDGSIIRFFSKNRPSTDALGVLSQWRDRHQGRSFEVIEDTDEHLVVKLALRDDDIQAGPDLHALGAQHGVQHEYVAQ